MLWLSRHRLDGLSEDTVPFGEELDLPVLLTSCDVGAGGAAMRDSAYRDPEARSMVNAEFIPIRVDTDHRPDINARYNLGGWRHGGADADVRRSLVGLRCRSTKCSNSCSRPAKFYK